MHLKAWLDGEIEPARAPALERHLAGCASCRAEAEAYRRISERIRVLAAAAAVAPQPSVEAILINAERARREEGKTVRYLKRVALTAAAVLVSALGALYFQPGAGDTSESNAEAGRDNVMAVVLAEPSFGEDL
jgi:anti-sigma factor RsiW